MNEFEHDHKPAWVIALADQKQALISELLPNIPLELMNQRIITTIGNNDFDESLCDHCGKHIEDGTEFLVAHEERHIGNIHVDMIVAACIPCSKLP